MKKKLLFSIESLRIGGAEKSLVTLLSKIDYKKFDVDLFLFNYSGEFISLVPKEVNIINKDNDYKFFSAPPIKSLTNLLISKKYNLFFTKFIFLFILTIHKYILKKEYIGWKYVSHFLPKFNKEYDLSVGFLEKKSIYFSVDHVKAKKKVGWIHTDYSKIPYNYKLDNHYFKELDFIMTVSKHCKEVLMQKFPACNHKIKIINNIVSPNLIKSMANEMVKHNIEKSTDEILIVTVCRLIPQKGIEDAINACEKLGNQGFKIKWIVIGDGPEKEKLTSLIKNKGLVKQFFLFGSKGNPYPYMKMCDIYVQPSHVEGFGITVLEAKILGKAIVTSDIPEFREQIQHHENGLTYGNIDELVSNIVKIIKEKDLSLKFMRNLENQQFDNSIEINQLVKII
ncbi:glycosyltransferase [Gottfriedia sp. NPDC058432]|uniref:glycosyltransferase n=1 Tax=Gottfriedia sp. NPDC058432 TaxID=3346497 RepID=UPI003653472E